MNKQLYKGELGNLYLVRYSRERHLLSCLECGNSFGVIASRIKKAKYCSLKCKYKNMDYKVKKGKVSSCLNCGKEYYLYPSRVKKGQNKFCSIKCRVTANTGKFIGEKNWNWKGSKAKYAALHTWVQRNLKKPTSCPICHRRKPIDWANKDHKYSRVVEDWMPMCHSCHCKYDYKNKLRKNQ